MFDFESFGFDFLKRPFLAFHVGVDSLEELVQGVLAVGHVDDQGQGEWLVGGLWSRDEPQGCLSGAEVFEVFDFEAQLPTGRGQASSDFFLLVRPELRHLRVVGELAELGLFPVFQEACGIRERSEGLGRGWK